MRRPDLIQGQTADRPTIRILPRRRLRLQRAEAASRGRGAHPPQNETFRTVIRSARFTPDEWAAVQQRAAEVRLSPARFLRYVALGTPLGRRLNAEVVVALNRAGVVLNNCVRIAIRNDQPLIASEVREVLDMLRERLRCFL